MGFCHDPWINTVVASLHQAGLEPYIFHYKGGSAYVKFNRRVGGTLRISDHPQRARYAYQWNLRLDIKEFEVKEKRSNRSCYYFPFNGLDDMIQMMLLVVED